MRARQEKTGRRCFWDDTEKWQRILLGFLLCLLEINAPRKTEWRCHNSSLMEYSDDRYGHGKQQRLSLVCLILQRPA